MLAFTADGNWQGYEHSHDGVVNIQNAITPNVREIHAYWLERRSDTQPSTSPVRRFEPRGVVMSPLPVGEGVNGTAVKKCCLH